MACLYPKTAISALFAIWTSFYHYKVTQLQCKHCWVCLFRCFLLLKQMKFVEKFLFSVRELFQSLRPNESIWKLIPRLRHASSLSSNTQINIFDTWHFFFLISPRQWEIITRSITLLPLQNISSGTSVNIIHVENN